MPPPPPLPVTPQPPRLPAPPPLVRFFVPQADADGFARVGPDKLRALNKREADSIPRQWWREMLELTVSASLCSRSTAGGRLPRITGHIAHSQCRVLGRRGRASLRSQMHELVIINHCSVWSCACHPVVRLVRQQASNAKSCREGGVDLLAVELSAVDGISVGGCDL